MNELFTDTKAVILTLFGVIMALLGWASKRLHDRVDNHLDRHDHNYVTRNELDNTIRKFHDDREDKHRQNVETLARIETKIDENEERAAKTRHEIRDKVNTLTTQVAVLEHVVKSDPR
jgi:hypothetical protein